MVTLEVEVAEEMEVLAKEENRTLTNWIATAALMELMFSRSLRLPAVAGMLWATQNKRLNPGAASEGR